MREVPNIIGILLLGGGFIFFHYHPYLGEVIQFHMLTNSFRMGWSHQLDWHLSHLCDKVSNFWMLLFKKPQVYLTIPEALGDVVEALKRKRPGGGLA